MDYHDGRRDVVGAAMCWPHRKLLDREHFTFGGYIETLNYRRSCIDNNIANGADVPEDGL
jgi:hypothetical protein